jgi:hypothetical protein
VRGGSAACKVVRWSFRFVTAVNKVLPLLSSGGGSGTSEVSVFVSAASPARFWFSAFSATTTLSAFGVIPVMKGQQEG